MPRRPAGSTLFPYTTLFRSSSGLRWIRLGAGTCVFILVIAGIALQLDRKSTRLNSSHQIISYAVFCLKKKNKKGNDRIARATSRQKQTEDKYRATEVLTHTH